MHIYRERDMYICIIPITKDMYIYIYIYIYVCMYVYILYVYVCMYACM